MSLASETPTAASNASLARKLFIAILSALTLVTGFAVAGPAPIAGATVTEDVRTDVPAVIDGRVLAVEKVGRWIVVGGNFQQVELPDGTIIDQPYLFAYHAETGEFQTQFRPQLDRDVRALEPAADGRSVYVGGAFSEADGRRRKKMARYNVKSGKIATTFVANTSSAVNTIKLVGNDLYIGGNFAKTQSQPRDGLVRVDAENGKIDLSFDLGTTEKAGRLQLNGNRSGGVTTVDATPDGAKLIVAHQGMQFGGLDRPGLAMVDLTTPTPTVTSFVAVIPDGTETMYTPDRCNGTGIRITDMEISPDGSYFVVSHMGADNLWVCDQIHRYETSASGRTSPTWRSRVFDSAFSVGIDDETVYVGGHMRYLPHPEAPSAYPGKTSNPFQTFQFYDADPDVDPGFKADLVDTGYVYPIGQIGALSPETGKGIPTWDPVSNAFKGVLDITITDDGLLLGQDKSRVQNQVTGRSAFFDNGPNTNTAGTNPTSSAALVGTAATATDGDTSTGFIAAGTDPSSRYWQTDLGLTTSIDRINIFSPIDNLADMTDISVFVSKTPFTSTNLEATRAQEGVTEYRFDGRQGSQIHIRKVARGQYVRVAGGGTRLALAEVQIWTPTADQACTVALIPATADQLPAAQISWSDAKNSTVQIRRNGTFLQTADGKTGTISDANLTSGTYSYVVRSRANGQTTSTQCGTITVTVAEPACSATLVGTAVEIEWSNVVATSLVLRRNGSFLAGVTGTTSYTDSSPEPTSQYTLRARHNGTTTNIPCGTANAAEPTCQSSTNADGSIELSWTDIGADRYSVRRNGSFLASTISTSFTDFSPTTGANTYLIRTGRGDIACGAVTVAAPTCAATVVGSTVELSWSDLGANSYSIRRNGSFLASTNGLSYVDFNPVGGTNSYLIRTTRGDISCPTVII